MTGRDGKVFARTTAVPMTEETAKPRMATDIESDVKVAADKAASL
jgi:hypothetical protein